MIVLDTNVLSEQMKPAPEPGVHNWLLRQHPLDLFTTAVTEAEILYGVAILPDGRRKQDLQAAAQRVLALFVGRILPFDSAAARVSALIVANRRIAGRPIDDFDAQIAAITRSRDMALATRDVQDFASTGVQLVDPWQPRQAGASIHFPPTSTIHRLFRRRPLAIRSTAPRGADAPHGGMRVQGQISRPALARQLC